MAGSDDGTSRIVEAGCAGPRLIPATAQGRAVTRALLMVRRKPCEPSGLDGETVPTFSPGVVARSRPAEGGRVGSVLGNGRRALVGPDGDLAARLQLVEAHDRR